MRKVAVYSDRGEEFPSMLEAAKAIGCGVGHLHRGVRTGVRVHGRRWQAVGRPMHQLRARVSVECQLTFTWWATLRDCARETGISRDTLSRHLNQEGFVRRGRYKIVKGLDYAYDCRTPTDKLLTCRPKRSRKRAWRPF